MAAAPEKKAELIIEHTLYSEEIGHIGNLTITNSLLNSWIAVFIVVIIGLSLKNKIKFVPRGFQNVFELILESFIGLIQKITGSRESAYRLLPLIFSFFLFILLNNWLGIIPGIGSIGKVVEEHGENFFIPFFRGGTADLNTTMALALIAVFSSHVLGVITLGAWNYFNKFINIKVFLEIPRKIFKEPTIIVLAPINFFVGLIEIVGEFAKVASLSFRLFGNIYAGEVLLASIGAILAFGAPIPFIFLEILVGIIQALVFSILTLSYLNMATISHDHH
jgi:F-type H+-transporting ATPase subunit a